MQKVAFFLVANSNEALLSSLVLPIYEYLKSLFACLAVVIYYGISFGMNI